MKTTLPDFSAWAARVLYDQPNESPREVVTRALRESFFQGVWLARQNSVDSKNEPGYWGVF